MQRIVIILCSCNSSLPCIYFRWLKLIPYDPSCLWFLWMRQVIISIMITFQLTTLNYPIRRRVFRTCFLKRIYYEHISTDWSFRFTNLRVTTLSCPSWRFVSDRSIDLHSVSTPSNPSHPWYLFPHNYVSCFLHLFLFLILIVIKQLLPESTFLLALFINDSLSIVILSFFWLLLVPTTLFVLIWWRNHAGFTLKVDKLKVLPMHHLDVINFWLVKNWIVLNLPDVLEHDFLQLAIHDMVYLIWMLWGHGNLDVRGVFTASSLRDCNFRSVTFLALGFRCLFIVIFLMLVTCFLVVHWLLLFMIGDYRGWYLLRVFEESHFIMLLSTTVLLTK